MASEFIDSCYPDDPGSRSELMVWEKVKSAFSKRDCIAYHGYHVFPHRDDLRESKNEDKKRKEVDILIVDQEFGVIVIEVKGLVINNIANISGDRWIYRDFYKKDGYPYGQAEGCGFALRDRLGRLNLGFQPALRAIVALPKVTKEEWEVRKDLHNNPAAPMVLFQDNLTPQALLRFIRNTPEVKEGSRNSTSPNPQQWARLKSALGSAVPFERNQESNAEPETRKWYIDTARVKLREFDVQQETIAKQIPPGVQRIRGVAGSGKTVLLCQRAAWLHLCNPSLDIAFVFNTRSLYESITHHIDTWLRYYSDGNTSYKEASSKLRVMHAWGSADTPGFYRTVAERHGVRAKSYGEVRGPHNQRLGLAIKDLLEQNTIEPSFNAIFIDEGQDLVFDDEVLHGDRQPFYWLAFLSLIPEDPAQSSLFDDSEQKHKIRRLYWAYDEAQSLTSLQVPKAKQIFGEQVGEALTRQGNIYPGGIKKSEIMYRCYRTPSTILMAAHALGMGLLRKDGMLTGLTKREEWKKLGYKVEGNFRPGNQIVLSRPAENSTNPIGELYVGSLLSYKSYGDRADAARDVAAKIAADVRDDGLSPDRSILVIPLGSNVHIIQQLVANALAEQGIDYYIPTQETKNRLPQYGRRGTMPNRFWYDGAVTISTIHRAKGNEADIVYVLGVEDTGNNEDNVNKRNELFVAMTRSRGWVYLCAAGEHAMDDEIRNVIDMIDWENRLKFEFQQPVSRLLDDDDD